MSILKSKGLSSLLHHLGRRSAPQNAHYNSKMSPLFRNIASFEVFNHQRRNLSTQTPEIPVNKTSSSSSSSPSSSSPSPSAKTSIFHRSLRFLFRLLVSIGKGLFFIPTFIFRGFILVYLYSSAFRGDGTSWSIAQDTGLGWLDPASGTDSRTGRSLDVSPQTLEMESTTDGSSIDTTGISVDYTKDHQISADWVPQFWINTKRNLYSIFMLSAIMFDYASINSETQLAKEEEDLLTLKVYLTHRERQRVGYTPLSDDEIRARIMKATDDKKLRHKAARKKSKQRRMESEKDEKYRKKLIKQGILTTEEINEKIRMIQAERKAERHALENGMNNDATSDLLTEGTENVTKLSSDPVLRRRELEERLVMYDVHSSAIALIRGVLDQESKLRIQENIKKYNFDGSVNSRKSMDSNTISLSEAAIRRHALENVASANDVPLDILFPAVSRHRALLQTHQRSAFRLLSLAHEQGGVYVKAAQYIATANDGIPKQYVRVLSRMHDRAAPLSLDLIRPVFLKEYGCELEELFTEFSPSAIAAASMAQVHRAKLQGGPNHGKEVAVKVQYRHISASLESDLQTISALTQLCERVFPSFSFGNMMEEFKRGIRSELDFINEGKNGERIAALLRHREDIHVPRVAWSHSTSRILVTEFIHGMRINDNITMQKHGIRPTRALDSFVEAFGEMLFSSGFLHCDPHPGNAMVRVKPSSDAEASDTWANEGKLASQHLVQTVPESIGIYSTYYQRKSWERLSAIEKIQRIFTDSLLLSSKYLVKSALYLTEMSYIPTLARYLFQQVERYILFGSGETGRHTLELDTIPSHIKAQQHQIVLLDHGLYTELSPKFRSGMSNLFASFLRRDPVVTEEACKNLGMGRYWKILHLVFTGRLPGSKRAARSTRWTKEDRIQLLEEFQDFDFGDVTSFISEMSPDLMYFTKTYNTLKSIGKGMGIPDTRQKQLLMNAALYGSKHDIEDDVVDSSGCRKASKNIFHHVLVQAPFTLTGIVELDLMRLKPLSLKDQLTVAIEQSILGFAFVFFELFIAHVEHNDPTTVKSK